MIDPYDIAAVAAAALTSDGHEGRVYTVSGPEPLHLAHRVRILGEVLGRGLRFEGQPDDEARAEMSASMPAEYVDAFFDFYVTGTLDESQPQPDVRDVTGRAPRTFRSVGGGSRRRVQAPRPLIPASAVIRKRAVVRAFRKDRG